MIAHIHATMTQIFIGQMIHSISPTELQILNPGLVIVNQTGIIEFVGNLPDDWEAMIQSLPNAHVILNLGSKLIVHR